MADWFGDGQFQFGQWSTPFENERMDIIDVSFVARTQEVICRLATLRPGTITYRVSVEVSAFQVLDEHGLTELWEKTDELGVRPAGTTFKVKNNRWSKESPISFLGSDGWSYVLATDSLCIEFVTSDTPIVSIE